jgi:hypothetical protein
MSEPLAKFRVSVKFSEDKKLNQSFMFFIWEHQKDMHDHNWFGKNYFAITIDKGLVKNKKSTKTVEIHLCSKRLSVGFVAHEIYHALCFFANRNNIIMQSNHSEFSEDEELCASVFGAIILKFYERLHKLKFIEEPDFFKSKDYIHYGCFSIK